MNLCTFFLRPDGCIEGGWQFILRSQLEKKKSNFVKRSQTGFICEKGVVGRKKKAGTLEAWDSHFNGYWTVLDDYFDFPLVFILPYIPIAVI